MIRILHQRRSAVNIPQTQYIGRPTILSNPFTHLKKKTKALHIVSTVEDAVNAYRECFYSELKTNRELRAELLRLEAIYRQTGVLYLSCWCRDELDPKPSDHGCHAEVVRDFLVNVLPVGRFYQEIMQTAI